MSHILHTRAFHSSHHAARKWRADHEIRWLVVVLKGRLFSVGLSVSASHSAANAQKLKRVYTKIYPPSPPRVYVRVCVCHWVGWGEGGRRTGLLLWISLFIEGFRLRPAFGLAQSKVHKNVSFKKRQKNTYYNNETSNIPKAQQTHAFESQSSYSTQKHDSR